MKSIVEYINESVQLNEAKKAKKDDILNGLDKIEKWVSANNIKKLIDSYMSAGDVEEYSKKHWDACVEAVNTVIDYIRTFFETTEEDEGPVIDLAGFSDWVAETAYNAGFIDDLNNMDPDGGWDEDELVNLFNTVSAKVCKETWLI